MNKRPVVTSFLVLTAGIAIAAAPRLLPAAGAGPMEAEPEINPVEESVVALTEHSELDERDAVAVAPEEPAVAEVVEPVRADPPARAKTKSRDVDLVIALDTSGSMEGLLDSARARLWDIVNAVGDKDPNARVRVGLVTFGSPNVAGPHEGFVKIRSDLTSDLDTLYGQVMALQTDGGEEFVGWTLHTSISQLSWSSSPGASKIIFIAGNESADQARGSHDFRTVAAQAKEQGILINAMFAGNSDQGQRERWAEVAEVGGGVYSAIDQQAGTFQVATPHDEKLQELNAALNETYVGYGRRGGEGKANQMRQDGNAQRMGAASISSRVSAKSKSAYDNAAWDLVDGVEQGALDLSAAPATALPEPLRNLDAEERQQFVEELADKREQLKKEIDEVSKKRKRFMKDSKPADADGLDDAILEAIDEQL